jgi:Uri superfamily endonuclease
LSTVTRPFRGTANCYCLILNHQARESIDVGALGSLEWPAGWTYYVGRSAYGWGSRCRRFLTSGPSHWHVDYLVDSPHSIRKALIPFEIPVERECALASTVESHDGVEPLAEGFGASDCEAGCDAHGWTGSWEPETLLEHLNERIDREPGGYVAFESDRSRWVPLETSSNR